MSAPLRTHLGVHLALVGTMRAAAEALGAPDLQLHHLTLLLGSAIAAPR